jgi:hypothetical protein
MSRSTYQPQPLLEPWFPWQQLPEDVRQQAFDVLTALFLESVHEKSWEYPSDDDH